MNIEQRVESILNKNFPSRDSDHELLLAWAFYEENMTDEEKQAFNIFKQVIRRMPALETITRARRELQKTNPYLRGENYNKRMSREKQLRNYYKTK